MSLLFLAGNAVGDLGEESAGGQLRRIYTAPVHSVQILAGQLGFAFLLVFGAFVLMMAVGMLAFGVRLQSPLLFLAGGACSSLACIGIMALVHSFLAPTAAQRGRQLGADRGHVHAGRQLCPAGCPAGLLPDPGAIHAELLGHRPASQRALSTGLPAGPPLRSGLILLAIGVLTLATGRGPAAPPVRGGGWRDETAQLHPDRAPGDAALRFGRALVLRHAAGVRAVLRPGVPGRGRASPRPGWAWWTSTGATCAGRW